MSRVPDRILGRFTDWFCSGGGVWQTAIVTMAVVVVECANRHLDPHAFVLMAALTVYSAITQPALAHSGAVAAIKMESLEQQAIDHEAALQERLDMLQALIEQLTNGDAS